VGGGSAFAAITRPEARAVGRRHSRGGAPLDPPHVHATETFLGCRPSQASHESPSWPQPCALEYLRAISFLCSRHKVASATTPPFSSACSQRMVRNVGPGFVRLTGAVSREEPPMPTGGRQRPMRARPDLAKDSDHAGGAREPPLGPSGGHASPLPPARVT
jgi:hypothetical protein